MIRRNCEECGKFFWDYPYEIKTRGRKYCSYTCAGQSKRSKRVEKECGMCGDKFIAKKSDIKKGRAVYCSAKCNTKALNSFNKNHPNSWETECIECGSMFKTNKSLTDKGWGKYCSKECAAEGKKKRVIKHCANCGKEFEVPKSASHNSFCSHDCYSDSITLYPKTSELRKLIKARGYDRNARKKLHDRYVKKMIVDQTGIDRNDIPKELIELKRLNVKRKRLIKNHNQKS